jgi:two-component system chemotaxis sensor kinase CheA
MEQNIEQFLKNAQRDLASLEEELSSPKPSRDREQLSSILSSALQFAKQASGMADFRKAQTLVDATEMMADRLGLAPDDEAVQALLRDCVSALKGALSTLLETGHEPEEDYSGLLARVQSVAASTAGEGGAGAEDYEALSPGAPPDAPLPLSIHDVAALLVQLEPTNLSDCARLAGALRQLASQAKGKEQVQKLLRQAAKKLAALPKAAPAQAEKTVAEVSDAIERITSLEENADLEEAPAGAPEEEAAAEFTLPPDSDLELLGEFVTESREFIAEAESALLSLEVDPENLEAVNTVFRAFHTIKGTSGFLGLTPLTQLAHRAESLLSKVRNREIRFSGAYADLALRSVDTVKGLVEQVDGALHGRPMVTPPGYGELVEMLEKSEREALQEVVEEPPAEQLRIGDILVAAKKADRDVVDEVAAQKGQEPLGEALVRSKAASLTDVAKALRAQQKIAQTERSAESSVRVRTERLDRLIDMVGELVIAQSMVALDSTVGDGAHHDLSKKISHAGKIVRELQDLSMSMRMVPFRSTFQRLARLIRDLSRKSGKLIEFETSGEDTEIDRNMVDLITDPLIHMVRNAVDHGIETPEERRKAGKPEAGRIRLRAFHSGGNVVVQLEDDGRGLDRDRILRKAIETGLIESDKGLADVDIDSLIFAPGFSTATEVTDVSGRGVGLDVVKRNIDSLRGRIEIASSPEAGCKFSLRLPLTLAITDGMLIKVGGEHYIIPTVNIHLSFRPSSSALFTVAGRGDLVMLRGELLPMFRLHRLFDVKGAIEDPTKGLLVVVGDGSRRCALLIDELLGQQQVVAKSLGRGLGKVHGISGGAILGDGRVGLILDTMEIVSLARQIGVSADRGDVELAPAKAAPAN